MTHLDDAGRLRPWLDRPAGWAVSKLGSVALSSYGAYATMLHGPWMGPSTRRRLAALRARAAYHHARRYVPAYRQFLAERGCVAPKRFADLPITSKDDYVRAYRLEETLVHGRLPRTGAVIDESSGSTGRPSNWVRGAVERAATRQLIQFASRAAIGSEPYVLINAFALGPWATGMSVTMSMVDACVVKSVGPDVQKIVNTLQLLGPQHRYVISGYPPFLKLLVDKAGIDWSRYRITAVVGGESMSEQLRRHLAGAFERIISSFGASDLEINLAVESPWSIALRRAMEARPALMERLTGRRDVLPMTFQYDPTQVFIENGPEGRLLFTLCRLENLSPRIRYDLGDRGVVRSFEEVEATCRGLGVELESPRTRLPVLFHHGRQEQAVAFFGCKITPEQVQAAIFDTPGLAATVAELGLSTFEDDALDKRLEVVVELYEGAVAPPPDAAERLFDRLADLNQDFRESRRMLPAHLAPRLVVEQAGRSRLSGQDGRIKRRYVLARG